MGGFPDGLPQSQLPLGVHGGGAEPKPDERRAADDLHERVQAYGHQCARPRHQRVDAAILGQQAGRRALRAGGDQGCRRSGRGEHHRRTDEERALQGHLRLHRTGRLFAREPQVPGKYRLCRRVRFDFGIQPLQVFRCRSARQQRRDLHRAADALRTALSERKERRR